MTFETGVEADECLKYNGHAYDNKQITVKVNTRDPHNARLVIFFIGSGLIFAVLVR